MRRHPRTSLKVQVALAFFASFLAFGLLYLAVYLSNRWGEECHAGFGTYTQGCIDEAATPGVKER
jgi:hypothetical protein